MGKKGDYLCHKRRYSDARIVGTRPKYMRDVVSWGQHIEAMSCPDCRNIVPLVVGGVIGDAAPSFNSLVGRLCLRCGSDRIHRWDMHTCPKCGGKMHPTGEEEFWT